MWHFKSVEHKKIYSNYCGDGNLFESHSAIYTKINFNWIKYFNKI